MSTKAVRNRIRLRISNGEKGEQVFKTIISHPMETGRRKDRKTGKLIAANYIEKFSVSVDGEKYIEIAIGENFARNPYLSFMMARPINDGQQLLISWIDNYGTKVTHSSLIELGGDGKFSYVDQNFQVVPGVRPTTCKIKLRSSTDSGQ